MGKLHHVPAVYMRSPPLKIFNIGINLSFIFHNINSGCHFELLEYIQRRKFDYVPTVNRWVPDIYLLSQCQRPIAGPSLSTCINHTKTYSVSQIFSPVLLLLISRLSYYKHMQYDLFLLFLSRKEVRQNRQTPHLYRK